MFYKQHKQSMLYYYKSLKYLQSLSCFCNIHPNQMNAPKESEITSLLVNSSWKLLYPYGNLKGLIQRYLDKKYLNCSIKFVLTKKCYPNTHILNMYFYMFICCCAFSLSLSLTHTYKYATYTLALKLLNLNPSHAIAFTSWQIPLINEWTSLSLQQWVE